MAFNNTNFRPQVGQSICPKCNEEQWSIADNRYIELFGQCWECDKKNWESGKLSLEEFENREKQSLSK